MFEKKVKLSDVMSNSEIKFTSSILLVAAGAIKNADFTRRVRTLVNKLEKDQKITEDELLLVIQKLTEFAEVVKEQKSDQYDKIAAILTKALSLYARNYKI